MYLSLAPEPSMSDLRLITVEREEGERGGRNKNRKREREGGGEREGKVGRKEVGKRG